MNHTLLLQYAAFIETVPEDRLDHDIAILCAGPEIASPPIATDAYILPDGYTNGTVAGLTGHVVHVPMFRTLGINAEYAGIETNWMPRYCARLGTEDPDGYGYRMMSMLFDISYQQSWTLFGLKHEVAVYYKDISPRGIAAGLRSFVQTNGRSAEKAVSRW